MCFEFKIHIKIFKLSSSARLDVNKRAIKSLEAVQTAQRLSGRT